MKFCGGVTTQMKPFQTYSHMVQLGIQCTVLLHELLKKL